VKIIGIGALSLLTTFHPAVAAEQTIFTMVQMDRLEYQAREEEWIWDMQGWVGGDQHKFWWKTEGDFDGNDAEIQLLYNRAISPFWDLQIGLKHSLESEPSENSAVIGLQGLAPQWFEVDVAAFLTEGGDLEARLEVEYDLLLTQRLTLQPRLELDSEENGTDVGLRLRYEIKREMAPYIGLSWRNSNRQDDYVSFIAGAKFWF
jgi:copper resistance protein B